MTLVVFLLTIPLLVFAYHYERNGDPANIGDFLSRTIWSFAVMVAYTMDALDDFNAYVAGWMIFGSFIAIVIPHAFAQRMGNRTDAWTDLFWTKWWPAYWLKPLLNTLSPIDQDFIGMASVGLLRGAAVFLPTVFFGYSAFLAITAMLLTAAWQPWSYYVGYKIPWNLWTNAANSSQWGEFGIGIGWAIALQIFCL